MSACRLTRCCSSTACPPMVEVPDCRLGAYIKKPNSFRLGDRPEVPDELCGIHVGIETQMFEFDTRIVLESIDGEITRLIMEYPKADPNKKIALEDGVPYAKCKQEECGKIIPPDKANLHLRKAHGKRFQTEGNRLYGQEVL